MTPTEAIPLLLVVLLLVSAGGGAVEEMDVVFDGDHGVTETPDVLVVAGGTVTVPADATAAGEVYVIGGTARVEGTVEGDVTLLGGNLTVADGAAVTGTLQTVAGEATVAEGATLGARETAPVPTRNGGPFATLLGLLLQVVVLGGAGALLVRRHPTLLANVGDSVGNHALVSGVVGALSGVTLLVIFVYMAFTLLLLPVSVLGLLGQALVVLYAYVVYGYLLGRRLPVERPDLATAVGVAVFVVTVELLGRVPVAGAIVQLGLVAVGFGAVLLTYFGLRRFEPASVPEVAA